MENEKIIKNIIERAIDYSWSLEPNKSISFGTFKVYFTGEVWEVINSEDVVIAKISANNTYYYEFATELIKIIF